MAKKTAECSSCGRKSFSTISEESSYQLLQCKNCGSIVVLRSTQVADTKELFLADLLENAPALYERAKNLFEKGIL